MEDEWIKVLYRIILLSMRVLFEELVSVRNRASQLPEFRRQHSLLRATRSSKLSNLTRDFLSDISTVSFETPPPKVAPVDIVFTAIPLATTWPCPSADSWCRYKVLTPSAKITNLLQSSIVHVAALPTFRRCCFSK